MKVPYLSATRLKKLKDCAFAYQCHYDAENCPSPDDAVALKKAANHQDRTQAARVGNVIHGALEDWRKPDEATGKPSKPRFGALMKHYEAWAAKPQYTVDLSFYEDGKNVLRRWFDRRGKNPVRIVAVEQKMGEAFAPYVLENGVPIYGFIDLVLEHKDGTIEIVDYKSNRAPKSQGEADQDVQAGIYLAWASEVYPDRPLKFSFEMLRFGVVTTIWSDEKISEFKAWLKTKYEAALAIEEAIPTIGDECKWCAFDAICPEAQRLRQVGAMDLILNEFGDDEEMLNNLATIKASKTLLERAQKKIEKDLRQRGELDPTKPAKDRVILTESWKVELTESKREEYVPHEVQRLVPPAVFGTMASLSKAAVERALPILPPDVAEAVEQTKITKPTTRLTIKPKPQDDKQG
jgi:hypothetical protein